MPGSTFGGGFMQSVGRRLEVGFRFYRVVMAINPDVIARAGVPRQASRMKLLLLLLLLPPCIFWTPAKCEVAHTSFPFSPSKVQHGDIYLARQEGTHGTKTKTS